MTTTSSRRRQPRLPLRPFPRRRPLRTVRARGKIDRAYYWMIMPVLALFGFFITLPALIGVFFSLTNYAGYGTGSSSGFTTTSTSSMTRPCCSPTSSRSSSPSTTTWWSTSSHWPSPSD